MDIKKTAREIGLFETARNLATVRDSEEIVEKVGASMPLPDADIGDKLKQVAEWLLGFGKSKYMFLSPEIALIEEMSKSSDPLTEYIIIVPCDLDRESKERLENNLPHAAIVTILEEPYFHSNIYPKNGLLVVTGYSTGERAMVLQETFRMFEHYNCFFFGKKVFVPYHEMDGAAKFDEWMEIDQQKITAKWRCRS